MLVLVLNSPHPVPKNSVRHIAIKRNCIIDIIMLVLGYYTGKTVMGIENSIPLYKDPTKNGISCQSGIAKK